MIPRIMLSLGLVGLLVGSLTLGAGCRLAGARQSAPVSTPPAAKVTTKPVVQESPVTTTNKPGFFARLFSSKPKPATTNVAKSTKPKPVPVVTTKPVASAKSVVQEAPPAATNTPGFFARLFGSKPASAEANVVQGDNPKLATVAAANVNSNKTFVPYRIQVNDTLMIALRGITPEQPNVELVVDEHGEIKLPYINTIKAEGHTTSELETLIRETYIQQKIYKRLTVNIIVPSQTQPTFYVKGEVRSPGRLPYVNGMTLLTAIVAAGGPTEFFTPNMILLRGGKKIKFNYYDLEKRPEQDQPIQAGDIIIVDKSWL